MATIDLTLNGIKIPALDGYTPPFGTKKVSGGLTTQEVNDNVIAPFVKERPIEITETSSTGDIEYNASLVINSADAVLTLGSGTYVGCTVKVIAATAGSVSYNSGTTDTLVAGQIVTYIWNGSAWINDINITSKNIAYADNAMPGVQPSLTAGAGIDINGTTISLTAIETGTCTWENSDIKIVGTYYKKNNVVCLSIAWTVKSSIASNTGSGWISGNMQDQIKPLAEFIIVGYAYLQGFTIGIRSNGTLNFYNRSSSSFAPNNGNLSCTYLVGD